VKLSTPPRPIVERPWDGTVGPPLIVTRTPVCVYTTCVHTQGVKARHAKKIQSKTIPNLFQ
jgi:hypothetical protein